MKVFGSVLLVILAVLFIGGCSATGWGVRTYNGLITQSQTVDEKWAQVQNVYQRRSDLIPNLVATVKGAANFEKSTFVGVAQARASVGQIQVAQNQLAGLAGPNGQVPLEAEKIKAFAAAQQGLGTALSRLMVVVEKYPELKATANFSELQAQIEGTENRITVERMEFNKAARTYNTSIGVFPGNLIAGFFRFTAKPYFEADPGAKKAPVVDFGG